MPDIQSGAQHKAMVEYAPSQRLPKLGKQDGREGTIYKGINAVLICAVVRISKCYNVAYGLKPCMCSSCL